MLAECRTALIAPEKREVTGSTPVPTTRRTRSERLLPMACLGIHRCNESSNGRPRPRASSAGLVARAGTPPVTRLATDTYARQDAVERSWRSRRSRVASAPTPPCPDPGPFRSSRTPAPERTTSAIVTVDRQTGKDRPVRGSARVFAESPSRRVISGLRRKRLSPEHSRQSVSTSTRRCR